MQSLDITIKQVCGAYVTNTIRGTRSSSTGGARQVAELQGRKLFGEAFARAELLHQVSVGTESWRLFATTEEA